MNSMRQNQRKRRGASRVTYNGLMSIKGGDQIMQAKTPDFLRAAPGFLVRDLHQNYLAAWHHFVNSKLTGPQYAILAVLNEYDGSDQSSVAEAALLDLSTMVDVARRLERNGLIVRTRSKVDGRRKVLQITALGERELQETRVRAEQLNTALFAHFPERREEITELLRELTRKWDELINLETESA